MKIESLDGLRFLYGPAKERSVLKQLVELDAHCQHFISLSPFLVIASGSADHALDASPRGGAPGFVQVLDKQTLLIPDSPGNNRLDTLENIISTGQVGLLFLIPGVDETLRVNGRARLSTAQADLDLGATEQRRPKLVIRVSVRDAYLHCAKALMRSELWNEKIKVERSILPTMGQMLKDQIQSNAPAEPQEEMLRRYLTEL